MRMGIARPKREAGSPGRPSCLRVYHRRLVENVSFSVRSAGSPQYCLTKAATLWVAR